MTEMFTVKTDVFEGPLDLLLSLIEKRKLHINDISLANVTDDFLGYVNELKEFPLSQAAHFILVASTLLLIKSRSLLPTLTLSSDETESIEDLERRLKIYQRFRELAKHISVRFGRRVLFAPSPSSHFDPVFSPSRDMSVSRIREGIHRVIRGLPRSELAPPRALVAKVISLEETMDRLSERITRGISISFREFSGKGKEAKIHIVVSFLALLELIKQGIISVKQDELFSDIVMESDTVITPRYDS